MKNDLNSLNNYLFEELERLNDNEELIMNSNKLRYYKKELTETGLLIAKIIHKRGQIRK